MARPKKRSKTKKILFAVEIIVLLVFIGGLYVYGQLNVPNWTRSNSAET